MNTVLAEYPVWVGDVVGSSCHILFPEIADEFRERGIQNVCNYKYGLTGLVAMLVGLVIVLQPFWNTQTGESRIWVYGRIDRRTHNG